MASLLPKFQKYQFLIYSIPVVLGGTYLGYKFRSTNGTEEEIKTYQLKKRNDGYVEYKLNENETVLVTQDEINLRMKKIQLEQNKLSLEERINKIKTKMDTIKDRIQH